MPILEVKNLKIYYFTPSGIVKAVDGVDLYIERGETRCIVGESGSGKSTLGMGIAGLIDHPGRIVDGEVIFDGKIVASKNGIYTQRLLGRRITLIFQDPRSALNPVMTVGEQISETLQHNLGLDRREAYKIAYDLLRKVEIPDPERVLHSYPHELSGGMAQRVVIAIALSTEPDLIIADEPTSALDVTVQAEILRLFRSLVKSGKRSVLFITHDLSVALEICDTTSIMYAGKIVEEGLTREIFEKPLHPYTQALLSSIPRIGLKVEKLMSISGEPPLMIEPPKGCRFHPRCPFKLEICDKQEPILINLS
ncbi:MAG: ABC transporter ATP-binding protein, partial [Desulfurococcales archaeon]|nr:ABC transporter ATP-binding protein [Desulfurococcales archaeon]